MDRGSPSSVSRNLLTELVKHNDTLPFDEIILYSKKKDVEIIKKNFQNLRVVSYSELHKTTGDYLVHFPVLPVILPNSKFLLYLYSKYIRRKKIIIQYHGDVRTELRSSYKDVVSLIHIPSYVFIPNLLKSADKVITHSYHMNKIIQNYGVLKSTVIPNAVDNYWFQHNSEKIRLSIDVDKKCLNVFYHGRLSWEKGVDLLLEAAAGYIKNNPNTVIYLAGDGSQKKYLKDLCSKLEINKKVVFLGTLNKENIKSYLKHVDIAIYPSRFDNFPLSVLEALACADCPVYFSKNIGIYDFAIRDNAQLNYFELSTENIKGILYSFRRGKGDVRHQTEFAKKYSWDRVVTKYIELYNSVLDYQ